MASLIFLLAALALLGAYLALVRYETTTGTRLFPNMRARFDARVEHASFIAEHVDFNAFVREEARAAAIRVGHFLAHITLQSVRAVERLLTRAVRYLRTRAVNDEVAAPRATERPFVQALGEFKEELKATRPPAPPEF
jgi:hypothetical protein